MTQILGRHEFYRRAPWLPLVLTAAAQRPGPFYFELPHKLVEPKVFGYRNLSDDEVSVSALMTEVIKHLDIQSIDVP
jgi:hypothetical protein